MDVIEQIILRIEAKLKLGASPDEFAQEVHALASLGQEAVGTKLDAGTVLYRVTGHHVAQPAKVEEVGHPPNHVAPLGRANRAFSPILYLASDPGAAMREYVPTAGAYVCLSKWETLQATFVATLGYVSNAFKGLRSNREVPDLFITSHQKLDTASRRVAEFMSKAFAAQGSSYYPFTAAIAESFLRSEGIGGVQYPSVAQRANTDNIALSCSFIESGIKLVSAEWVRMRNCVEGTILARAAVLEGGILDWKHTSSVLTPETQSFSVEATPAGVIETVAVSQLISIEDTVQVASSTVLPSGRAMKATPGTHTMQSDGEIVCNGRLFRLKAGFKMVVDEKGVNFLDDLGWPVDSEPYE